MRPAQSAARASPRHAISGPGPAMARPALAARWAAGTARHQAALVWCRGNDVDSIAVMRMHRKRKTITGWADLPKYPSSHRRVEVRQN
jgi:hypothetical protein